ncbi:MAG: glycine--tRNA ligase [Eubacteriales bacterium]|nr:glycine--tRNA ligase [Eubacteriales bacterium]
MNPQDKSMEKIVALAKNRGLIYPGSEIYGGLANAWDYGPYGVELKRNVKEAWWQSFVQKNHLNVGLDAGILMNPEVWVSSGHVGGFSDPLIDCKNCHARFRADQLLEDYALANSLDLEIEGMEPAQLSENIQELQVPCPDCGKCDFTEPRQFNLMFKTFQGVTEDNQAQLYLRPETAQGIFVNFKNVQRSSRRKLPFGICQIGKSFRNEITPGNFIFRTREFEQMELEFFCEPGTDLEWFEYWREFCREWLLSLGLKEEELRLRDHGPEELSFYSKATTDFEFLFPFGWGELWGVADRTDYDLAQHQEGAKEDMRYFDPVKNEKFLPYCIEPSLGVERMLLAFLCSAYDEEELANGETRTVLRFHPDLAPVKLAILPLSAKLSEPATQLFRELSEDFVCEYDDRQSIGKRYRRQDEIGTPYCITYDFDSLEDSQVTVRERDSMEQIRLPISEVRDYIREQFAKRRAASAMKIPAEPKQEA